MKCYYLLVENGRLKAQKEGRCVYYLCSTQSGNFKKVNATWVRGNIKYIRNATIRGGRITYVSPKMKKLVLKNNTNSGMLKGQATALTWDEEAALLQYKSSESYKINKKLREQEVLSENDLTLVKCLDSALLKLPIYKGILYRNIIFDVSDDAEDDFNTFMKPMVVGAIVTFKCYTSSSTTRDGYNLEGNYVVHMVINSKNGRDLDGHGNNSENEVLFPRNLTVQVLEIMSSKKGQPILCLQEV